MPSGRHQKSTRRSRWRMKSSPRFSRRRFLIGSAAVVIAGTVITHSRWLPILAPAKSRRRPIGTRRLLNGVWDFQPASAPLGARPHPDAWHPIRVPSEWNMTAAPNFSTPWGAYDIWKTPPAWDSATAGWYRTHFHVIPDPQKRTVITFDAVNFAAVVYVNGHRAGDHVGGTVPFSVDVTSLVTPGDNLLWVAVTGPASVRGPHGFPYPMGSWWGQLCAGIWQDVWLCQESLVNIGHVAIDTSTRRRELSVSFAVENQTAASVLADVTLTVWDGSRAILRHDRRVAVAAGHETAVQWTSPWTHARWWSPEHPQLYELTLDVRSPGMVDDSTAIRFGFREVWTDGSNLILNGRPLKLFGDEWHYFGSLENSRAYAETWFKMARQAHVNYVRLHAMPYPPVFYDVADEMGMLIVAESAIYGSSKNLALQDPDFWTHAKEHLTARVLRDRHHPSIILWSAENEILTAYGPSWASRVASLKAPILAVDTTRPIYFEGDDDPEGQADLISWHYPLEITRAPAIPESFYAFVPGQPEGTRWNRQKPLMISEFGLMWEAEPPTLTVAFGPDTYHGMDELWEANALITQAQIEGFRAAGVTGVTPWNLVWYGNRPLPSHRIPLRADTLSTSGPKPQQVGAMAASLNPGWTPGPSYHANALHHAIQSSFVPQAAFAISWARHAYAAQRFACPITVHNDLGIPAVLTLAWSWSGQGRTVSGRRTLSLPAGGAQRVRADVDMPVTDHSISGTWTTTLYSADNRVVDRRERPLSIYPRTQNLRRTVALIDPQNTARHALGHLGVSTSAWDGVSLDVPIVVGENAAPAGSLLTTLLNAAHHGARIIVLAQPPGWSPTSHLTVGPVAVSRTFPEAPHDPMIAGLDAVDLSWWRGNADLVADGLYPVPADPAFFVAADGGPQLSGASLIHWSLGRGQIWLCQYPVISREAVEPMAQEIFKRLLISSQTTTIGVPFYLWGSRLAQYLKGLSVSTIPERGGLLAVDCSDSAVRAEMSARSATVRSWVRRGGHLWIHRGSASESLIQVLTGVHAQVAQVPLTHQHGALNTHRSRLTDGISNAVLNWPHHRVASKSWGGVPEKSQLIVTTLLDWSQYQKPEQIKQASVLRSYEPPETLLWARKLGKGWLVVDELNWDGFNADALLLASRLTAALRRS